LTGFCRVNRVTESTRRVSRVTPGHGLCYFFINPARFQPQISRVPGQPAGLGRVSKHCINPSKIIKKNYFKIKKLKIYLEM
jgi:hypothetical protein